MQKTHQIQGFELDLFNEQDGEQLRYLDQIINERELIVFQAKSLMSESAPKYIIFDHQTMESVSYEDYATDGELFYWVESKSSDPWCGSTSPDNWKTIEEITYDIIPVDDGAYSSMGPKLVRLLCIAPKEVIVQFTNWAMSQVERYPTSKEAIEYLCNFGRKAP